MKSELDEAIQNSLLEKNTIKILEKEGLKILKHPELRIILVGKVNTQS